MSQVLRHQLSVWMWTGKGPLSVRVCTMVMSLFKEDMNWYFLPRYLPRPENSDKKTCRSLQLRTIWDLFSRELYYIDKCEILRSMYLSLWPSAPTRPTGSWKQWQKCQLQSATAFLIVSLPSSSTLTALQNSCEIIYRWLIHYEIFHYSNIWSRCKETQMVIMNHELPDLVTHATWIWALFVRWTMEPCQRSGCLL